MSVEIGAFIAARHTDKLVAPFYRERTCASADKYFARILTAGTVRNGEIFGGNGLSVPNAKLAKLFQATVTGFEPWLPNHQSGPIRNLPVLVKNPEVDKSDNELGETNVLLALEGYVFIGVPDGHGVTIKRPVRGTNMENYNYQTELKTMYSELLAATPNLSELPQLSFF